MLIGANPLLSPLLHSLQSSALPGSQLGGAVLLGAEGLEIASEMTWRSRYPALVDGKRFIGAVHVYPKGGGEAFNAADLASFLRSDYPGFLDLLVTAASASAIVRTRRFLYISAERVDRDPLLLRDVHPGFIAPTGADAGETEKAAARAALRAVCHRYEVALYHGAVDTPLRLGYRLR
jgi:hypothetical protein